MDRRRSRGRESREIIVRAAVRCIATHGLGSTTLDRVARLAQVSRALVVFHFKSKQGLLEEVLEHLGDAYSAGWEAALERGGGSTLDRVLRLVDYDVRFASDHPDFVSAWHAFWGEANGNSLYRERSLPRDRRYAGDLRALLATLCEERGHDPASADAIQTGVTAMLFGLWVESHLNPGPDRYRQGVSALRIYLHRLFPDDAASDPGAHRPSAPTAIAGGAR